MEETQLLFEQGQDPTANCPVCSRAGPAFLFRVSMVHCLSTHIGLRQPTVYEGIVGRNDTRFVVEEVKEEIEEINKLLQCCAPSVCAADDGFLPSQPQCDLFAIPTTWNGAFYLPWKDTLSNADYFSEWLLLQSLNNMSLPSELTFEKILHLARIHEVSVRIVVLEIATTTNVLCCTACVMADPHGFDYKRGQCRELWCHTPRAPHCKLRAKCSRSSSPCG